MLIVNALLQTHGGVQGIVRAMERHGLGKTASTWVSRRLNLPISADHIVAVFGSLQIREFASQFGLETQDLAQRLANALPATIDKLTPEGLLRASN